MKLEGSCHCSAVTFSLNSSEPYPFNRCYCTICRKTAGGGGYSINLGGDFDSLKVNGEGHISVYQARILDPGSGKKRTSLAKRHFCADCGSALWLWDPRWPELVHPFASAIDTPLPVPPQRTHMMLSSSAPWMEPHIRDGDATFDDYPDESLAEWHILHGFKS